MINIDYLTDSKNLSKRSYFRFKKFYEKYELRKLAASPDKGIERYFLPYCIHKSMLDKDRFSLKLSKVIKIDFEFKLDQIKDLEVVLLKLHLKALIWAGTIADKSYDDFMNMEYLTAVTKVDNCFSKQSLLDAYHDPKLLKFINAPQDIEKLNCFKNSRKDILACTRLIYLRKFWK